ncbi:hypothetical protein LTR37_009753 [Vermiconidia calcicola]|uniref:Uncharacterized protein n=1 Tax=Vermiconidia calcicola TaxID=1690605 RepID=A0ACC3N710_9PEZI|nr:hypothetical protein LTR37_009753 [Vermiconidia calcicola]
MATKANEQPTLTPNASLIKYTVATAIDPDGTLHATRCNCSFCQKLGCTNLRVASPSTDFKLLQPASMHDNEDVGDYSKDPTKMHRWFCKKCSVLVYMEGVLEWEGQEVGFFMVNVGSIDQPQEGVDLGKIKLQYVDMLNDNIHGGLKGEPWGNGLP